MVKRLLTALVVIGAVVSAWAAQRATQQAQAPKPAPGIVALKSALGLTDEQVRQLTLLRREEAQLVNPLRQQVQEKGRSLRDLLNSANPDPAAVGSLTLEIRNLRQQIQQINQQYHEKALGVLTAEQRSKLEELQKANRRMARLGPAVQGARLLNLLPPPPPAASAGATEAP